MNPKHFSVALLIAVGFWAYPVLLYMQGHSFLVAAAYLGIEIILVAIGTVLWQWIASAISGGEEDAATRKSRKTDHIHMLL